MRGKWNCFTRGDTEKWRNTGEIGCFTPICKPILRSSVLRFSAVKNQMPRGKCSDDQPASIWNTVPVICADSSDSRYTTP